MQRPDPSSMSPNPDPRGPCGAKLETPSFAGDGLTIYTSPANVEVFLWVRRLPPGVASQLIDATSNDVRPACPPFTSRTPYDYAQLNEFLGAIALPKLGDQRIAFAARVRQKHRGTPWTYASEAFVRRGDYLTAITVVSTARQGPTFVRSLTARAAAELAALPNAG